MRSTNPVFSSSPAFTDKRGAQAYNPYGTSEVDTLEQMYGAPPAGPGATGRMTLDDVVMRTAIIFAVLLAFAAVGWYAVETVPLVVLGGMIGGLVLGLIIAFKQSTNPALILSYAAFEGLFVGGVSRFYQEYVNVNPDGTVPPDKVNLVGQAVLGTLVAFGTMLALYKSGRVRATPKFTRWVLIAGASYLVLSLANFVAGMFGVGDGWGFRTGGLGILMSVAGVAIASLFLILDFDNIERGIKQGVPQRYAWLAAFGLVVTLVWLYLEFLRLLAILRGDD